MTAIAETKGEFRGGPKLETGGTANLTTTARRVTRLPVIVQRNRSSIGRDRVGSGSGFRYIIMKPARAAVYLGGGILLAAWLASAAGVGHPSIPQPPAPSTEAMQLDALASGVQSQATHLRQRLAAAPAPHSETRNPFAFAAAERPQPAAVEKAVDAEPVSTMQTVPEPNLVLLGLAEDGSTRTAMIESGDDLVMATEGQTIVGRYRVAKISADGIELVDLVTGTTRRLLLKTPASLL